MFIIDNIKDIANDIANYLYDKGYSINFLYYFFKIWITTKTIIVTYQIELLLPIRPIQCNIIMAIATDIITFIINI